MTDFFELAKSLSRTAARLAVDPLTRPEFVDPQLDPLEKEWLELQVGRHVDNAEAQLLLREAKLMAAFNIWSEGRK